MNAMERNIMLLKGINIPFTSLSEHINGITRSKEIKLPYVLTKEEEVIIVD
jgi:hypothetical protein